MGKRKQKYTSGEATQFVTKRAAERNLQITDRDFQRLRVLTGTHPVEPQHRKRVGKGSTFPREYFLKKDVAFVGRNPIIGLLRQKRIFYRKLKRAHERKDEATVKRLQENMPDDTYHIDNIIYDRYPTPVDALNDIDDCLNFVFMFSRVPSVNSVRSDVINLCCELAVEFLNYVIVTRALRKVFASIKGFYFQADIHNTLVTWMMPFDLVHKPPTNVEFGLFKFYADLYTRLLQFALVWLYKEKNLIYPPKLQHNEVATEDVFAYIASLNQPLSQRTRTIDSLDSGRDAAGCFESGDFAAAEEKMLKAHLEMQSDATMGEEQARAAEERLRDLGKARLFSGVKIFLGRETPRQVLCVVVRSCGGLVSWPETCGPGSTFPRDDPEIRYEVVDRPLKPEQMLLNRKYVQPQWVLDSLNAGAMLPTDLYCPGASLPPHRSPFAAADLEEEEEEEEEEDEEEEEEMDVDDRDDAGEEEEEKSEEEEPAAKRAKKSKIVPGRVLSDREIANARSKRANEEKRLRESLLPKKHRQLYKKMVHSVKRTEKEKKKLKEKRKKAKQEAR